MKTFSNSYSMLIFICILYGCCPQAVTRPPQKNDPPLHEIPSKDNVKKVTEQDIPPPEETPPATQEENHGHGSILLEHIKEGFPVLKGKYELELIVNMSFGSSRQLRSEALLAFLSYIFADGWWILVLEKQKIPSTTLVTYSKGIIQKEYFTDIRILVDSSETEDGLSRARSVVKSWQDQYPELANQKDRKYQPDILFFFNTPPSGRFYLILDPRLSLPTDEKEKPIQDAVFNNVKSRYRWAKEEDEKESYDPNTYEALSQAVWTLISPRVPKDIVLSKKWQVEDKVSANAVMKTIANLHSTISSFLPVEREFPFKILYSCVKIEKGEAEITGNGIDLPELGQGFILSSYKRQCLFNIASCSLIYDKIDLVVKGQNLKQSVDFSLCLRQGK